MIDAWTTEQWLAFAGFAVAGLAALGLLTIAVRTYRGWTAPAHPVVTPQGWDSWPHHWRTRRDIAPHELDEFKNRWRAAAIDGRTMVLAAGPVATPLNAPTERLPLPVIDPTGAVLEHLAPGPGSLTDLARHEGSIARITHDDLVDPEVARWFAEAFDRPAHLPARDEARERDEGGALVRFRTAVEPAMRRAHLWAIQGRGHGGVLGAGRAGLDHWHMECPTGGWPFVRPAIGQRLTGSVYELLGEPA